MRKGDRFQKTGGARKVNHPTAPRLYFLPQIATAGTSAAATTTGLGVRVDWCTSRCTGRRAASRGHFSRPGAERLPLCERNVAIAGATAAAATTTGAAPSTAATATCRRGHQLAHARDGDRVVLRLGE